MSEIEDLFVNRKVAELVEKFWPEFSKEETDFAKISKGGLISLSTVPAKNFDLTCPLKQQLIDWFRKKNIHFIECLGSVFFEEQLGYVPYGVFEQLTKNSIRPLLTDKHYANLNFCFIKAFEHLSLNKVVKHLGAEEKTLSQSKETLKALNIGREQFDQMAREHFEGNKQNRELTYQERFQAVETIEGLFDLLEQLNEDYKGFEGRPDMQAMSSKNQEILFWKAIVEQQILYLGEYGYSLHQIKVKEDSNQKSQ